MTPHKIIGNYCQLYGIAMPEIDYSQTRYFVAISPARAEVMYLREPSRLLGRVVGQAMKRGTVLFVQNGWVKLLTWENWKKLWERLFVPRKRDTRPEPNTARPYRSEIFEQMQAMPRYHKPSKRGFERTFIANQSMNAMTRTNIGLRAEYL